MRRVGKSTILSQIKNDILLDINEHDKIFINFESFKFSKIKDSEDLYGYVEDIIGNSDEKFYLFFMKFNNRKLGKAINAFNIDFNCNIYISGLNSSLLSIVKK